MYVSILLRISIPIRGSNNSCTKLQAAECAEIMGYFVPTDMFWKILIRRLNENPSPGHYAILAALLKHNPKCHIVKIIDEIIADLADSGIRETREVKILAFNFW